MHSGQYIVLPSDHKTELIWAGTGDVTVNIPPGGKRDLDAFYTKNKYHQIFFQQRTTSTVYKYRNLLFGHYKMVYTFLSDNFLTASIEIEIDHEEKGLKIISHKP